MPPTLTPEKPGTGTAITEQEKINWVSLEDSEKLSRYIGRRFVRKGNEADAKKFFYVILDIFAYQPSSKDPTIFPNTDQQLYKFNVQKYYRDKIWEVTKRDSAQNQVKVKTNQPVESHESRNGNFVLVDPWASFPMDSAKFLAAFSPDAEE